MMPCAYCIGCVHYKPYDKPYCERPDRDKCVSREFWAARGYDGELYPSKPDEYKPMAEG